MLGVRPKVVAVMNDYDLGPAVIAAFAAGVILAAAAFGLGWLVMGWLS